MSASGLKAVGFRSYGEKRRDARSNATNIGELSIVQRPSRSGISMGPRRKGSSCRFGRPLPERLQRGTPLPPPRPLHTRHSKLPHSLDGRVPKCHQSAARALVISGAEPQVKSAMGSTVTSSKSTSKGFGTCSGITGGALAYFPGRDMGFACRNDGNHSAIHSLQKTSVLPEINQKVLDLAVNYAVLPKRCKMQQAISLIWYRCRQKNDIPEKRIFYG